MHFFDICTSKSRPTLRCFVHFYFQCASAPQRRALFPHLHFQKWSENGVFLYILTSKCASRHNGVHFFHSSSSKSAPRPTCFATFDFQICFAPQRRAPFHIATSKSGPSMRVFLTFTSKCASRHNGVHFFDSNRHRIVKKWPEHAVILTFFIKMCLAPQRRALFRHRNFQKWPERVVILAFFLKMCFAPQRRALFQHRNVQKSSGAEVFCTFLLPNVLRATTACTFSTSQLPKVVREWCVLYILTSKCASRHNGVHFFHISTSKSGPRMVCFVHF